jgi:hypothetical protein
MAVGVIDALSEAKFIYADPDNELERILQGQDTVLRVESVVNSETTVVQLVGRIRKYHHEVRIVLVSGVV